MKNSKLQIHHQSDSTVVLREAKKTINNYLTKFINKQILFLTSGGSALKLLEGIASKNLGKNVTISVLDERYSTDPSINNFAQVVATTFYKNAKKQGCSFVNTQPKKGETQDELVKRFEEELRTWRQKNPNGIILATTGIGPDGHISGVLPFPENKPLFKSLFEEERWVVAYDGSGKNPYPLRVTTTLTFLKTQIDIAVAYVIGSNKEEVLKKALYENVNTATLPSVILKKMKHVELFTDCEV